MIIDLPPLQQEMVVCSIYAAKEYNIPTTALLAIAEAEGGKPGQWIKNKNGSYDIGTMQFNTNYLKELEKFGITTKDVEKSGCYPYHLAAWRINQHLRKDKGEFWTKIANYHSKTPNKNAIYKAKLIPLAAKWEAWLKSKFLSKMIIQI
ncbi:transglycosylase SLT domain-containing protein [Phocoenobacter uteri]|uniref:transglycosylase SLT domain-containing protein n=1 Tax=Phocoenobacter uteri TaxID=146806 RepID=UPI002441FF58|nr:transglycosylase SLT domain-containing protein [Phocoenobacter uteri]